MLGLRLWVAALALGPALLSSGCSRVHLGSHDAGGGEEDAGPAGRVQCGDVLCAPGQICCSASCNLCGSPDVACPAVLCAHDCTSDADCGMGELCRFADGACSGPGVCTAVTAPDACPPVVRETCGCDGVTYLSPCEAYALGASVRHDGPCAGGGPCGAQDATGEGPCDLELGVRWNGTACESFSGCACAGADCDAVFSDRFACEVAYGHCRGSELCASNADCGSRAFCYFPSGACPGSGALGECRPIPGEIACPFDGPRVCGCDGVTYDCEAAAHQVGVSVLHVGACSAACAPMDAVGVGACAAFFGYRWSGSTCEGVGGCSCAGEDCDRLFPNEGECLRTYEGCGRMPGGPCGGLIGHVCRPDEWCDFPEPHSCGGGDESGTCRPRPVGCETTFDPVCGCDGAEYGNACSANQAGYDALPLGSSGSCGAPPP